VPRIGTVFVLLALTLACAILVYSQAVTATLLGTLSDTTGAIVPNAKVTLTEENTGLSKVVQSNESGNFTFPDLSPGRYSVTAESAGFKKEIRKGTDVAANSSVRIDLRMQPGNISESVEVTASAPVLETDRADVGRSNDTVAVANLPMGTNRNFQSLVNLVPGTTPAQFQHSQFFNAGRSLQTEVNGQGRQGNSYRPRNPASKERS
jgi:hypothetical protein